jgi:hypothetical protein
VERPCGGRKGAKSSDKGQASIVGLGRKRERERGREGEKRRVFQDNHKMFRHF